jgi:hypothetical protein
MQSFLTFAQDSLINQIAKNNHTLFSVQGNSFKGVGWEKILTEAKKSNFVMIGEDHFINEVPFFCNALTSQIKFDNFFCEIDPYSSKIIASKIKTLSDTQLRKFETNFGNTFSFFAVSSELELLKNVVKSGTNVYGLDQVLMIGDRLLCSELKTITKNSEAKAIYDRIELRSKDLFENFLKDPNNPMYMMTEDFNNDLKELELLMLSPFESEVIDKMKLSAKIYKEQNHHLRIQLMKNQLMENFVDWKDKKNLFKFGANHLAKGESFLKIYDIGNLINNIADSQYSSSLHVLIIGKSGAQGSPFKGFPEQPIHADSDNLKALKPFFDIVVNPNDWYCLDMLPIRKKLENGEINTSIQLSRIIEGYDYVVIIPKVTAATFPK